jgi:hypothetical protein
MKIHIEFDQPIVELEILDIYGKYHPEVKIKATYSSGTTKTHWFQKGHIWKIDMDAVEVDVNPRNILKEIANHV